MFRGASKLTLDAKFRLAMPSRYRERLDERCGGKLVVTVDRHDPCLMVYPYPDWEEKERLLMKLPTLDPEARMLQRMMVGHATEIDLDGNGRILLPQNLRDHASLTRDVTLVGQGMRFELWDETRWKERREQWLASPTSAALSAELETLSL